MNQWNQWDIAAMITAGLVCFLVVCCFVAAYLSNVKERRRKRERADAEQGFQHRREGVGVDYSELRPEGEPLPALDEAMHAMGRRLQYPSDVTIRMKGKPKKAVRTTGPGLVDIHDDIAELATGLAVHEILSDDPMPAEDLEPFRGGGGSFGGGGSSGSWSSEDSCTGSSFSSSDSCSDSYDSGSSDCGGCD